MIIVTITNMFSFRQFPMSVIHTWKKKVQLKFYHVNKSLWKALKNTWIEENLTSRQNTEVSTCTQKVQKGVSSYGLIDLPFSVVKYGQKFLRLNFKKNLSSEG